VKKFSAFYGIQRDQSTVQYSTVEWTLQWPLALWTKCSTLLTEKSAESPGFKKWWPGSLNLNIPSASQPQRKCEAISDARLHPSYLGLCTSPSLGRYHFKSQCSASNLVNIHSWFLFKLSNSRAPLVEGLLRKCLTYFCPQMDCQYSLPHVSCSYNPYPEPGKYPTSSCPISLRCILILSDIRLDLPSAHFPRGYSILLFEVQSY